MNTLALGRPFSLGMLYDCRSDKLVPGVTLWDSDAFEKHVRRQTMQRSETRVIVSDSIRDKAKALGVSAELKVSIMGGLVTADGSGSYFQDSQESSEVVRVTLKYQSNSHFEQLSMEHLGPGNYKYPQVFDNGIATHVVTGIEYGADAFFVFEKDTNTTESSTALHGHLEAIVKSISLKFKGDVTFDSDQNEATNNVSCNFHGDFKLDTIPTTYKEALQVIERLPELLKENTPVPKRVHLFPLCNLDTRAARLMRSISESLIDRVERILQKSIHCHAQVAALSKSSAVSVVPFLRQQIDDYEHFLNLASSDFKKQLLALLPAIRGGGEEEEKLVAVLCQWERSAVAPSNFQSVITGIGRTVSYIENQLTAAKKQAIQEAFGPSLDQITLDINKDLIICFTLNTGVLMSKGLEAIGTHLHDNKSHGSSSTPLPEWHNNEKLKTTIKEKFRLFLEYATLNKDREKEIQYVITDGEGLDNEEPVLVQAFEPTGQGIISLASAPGKPFVSLESTTPQSEICVEWKCPAKGKETVDRYILWYRLAGDESGEWKRIEVDSIPKCHPTNLKQGMKYLFKVQAITKAGISPESHVSDPVFTCTERLALRSLQRCQPCQGADSEIEIYYDPKGRCEQSHGQRVKKYEIGEKHVDTMREKTIMMVGTGKTTFLNSMFNYLMGVRMDDSFRFKMVTEEEKDSQEEATSVTTNVTEYMLHETILPYTLRVIDTGYIVKKKEALDEADMTDQLFQTNDQLDAACLVVKSTDTRLTMFSSDMADNVIAMVAFIDPSTPVLLAPEEDKMLRKLYKFNNTAFFKTKEQDELGNAVQQLYWDIGQASFSSFFEGLGTLHPKSLTQSLDVLTKYEKLQKLIIQLQEQNIAYSNDAKELRRVRGEMETANETRRGDLEKEKERIEKRLEALDITIRETIKLINDLFGIFNEITNASGSHD